MKIVGGSQASHGQFPWQVIIFKKPFVYPCVLSFGLIQKSRDGSMFISRPKRLKLFIIYYFSFFEDCLSFNQPVWTLMTCSIMLHLTWGLEV